MSLLFELPLLKLTFHAFVELPARGVSPGPPLVRGEPATACQPRFREKHADEPASAW